MAHECPECGMQCYCYGYIDDMCLNTPEAVNRCTHCPEDAENVRYDEDESDIPNSVLSATRPQDEAVTERGK